MATIYQSKFTGSQIDGGIEKVTDHENRITTLENNSGSTSNSVTYELVDDNGTLKLVGSDGSVSDVVYGTVSLEEYCQFTQTNSQNIDRLGSRVSALEEGNGLVEQVEIASSNWVASTDTGVYSYKASITLSNLTADSLSIELINDAPVLFSTYGFAIAEIDNNNNVVVFSIGQPADTVTLTFEIVNPVSEGE